RAGEPVGTILLQADPSLGREHGCIPAPPSLVEVTRAALVKAGHRDVVRRTVTADSTSGAGGNDFPALLRRFTDDDPPQGEVVHAFDLVSAAVALSAGRAGGWAVVVRAQLAGAPMSRTARTLWPV